MKGKTKTRNCSIDLMRIIACLFVIMAHMQLGIIEGNKINHGAFFVRTLVADNVPLFFLITGFFFFRTSKSIDSEWEIYKKRILKFFTNLWIPSIIIAGFYCFVVAYKAKTGVDWSLILNYILKNKATGRIGAYWYLCTYLQFVIFSPMIAAICKDTPETNKVRRLVMFVTFLMVVSEDIKYVFKIDCFDFSTVSVGFYFLYLLLGYELSLLIPKLKNKNAILRFGGLAVYLIAITLKVTFQLMVFKRSGMTSATRFFWLQNSLCYFSSFGLFCFIYSLEDLFKNKVCRNVISWIGSKTFYIYLIHGMILFLSADMKQKIITMNHGCKGVIESLLYYAEYAGIVFLAGLLFAVVFELLYDKCIKGACSYTFKHFRKQENDEPAQIEAEI